MLDRLTRALHHPVLHLSMGAVLATTGLCEVMPLFFDGIEGNEWSLKSEHGVSMFGLVLFLRSIGDAIGGVRDAKEGLVHARHAIRPGHAQRETEAHRKPVGAAGSAVESAVEED